MFRRREAMARRPYPTDRTDEQWAVLEPLVPPPKAGGRPATHERRELINALLYVLRSGGAWRLLPHEFSPWQTVYHYFRLWRLDGTWERLLTTFRERDRGAGRPPAHAQCGHPRQPVGGHDGKRGPRGYDAGKHVRGRKHHLLVDTDRRIVSVRVHPAHEPDGAGARPLLAALRNQLPRLALIWVDGGYKSTFATWVADTLGWRVEAVRPPGAHRRGGPEPPATPTGFRVLPRRWVVERTFAWLGRQRRLSKDYEGVPATEEAWIELTMMRLLVARLAT